MRIRMQMRAAAKVAKLFAKAAVHGDGAAARDIESVLISMIPAKMREAQGQALRQVPAIAEMFAKRPLLPPGFGPDHVAHCRPGTLGEAYVRLMQDFELTQEFFPELDTSDDLSYFRRRMMETHDIWHVLTDCPATIEGEVRVIGFYFGHFARYLRGPSAAYNVVVGLNLVAGLTYLSHHSPRRLPLIVRLVAKAMRQGFGAVPLFSASWEEQWDRPLRQVQRTYLGKTTLIPTPMDSPVPRMAA